MTDVGERQKRKEFLESCVLGNKQAKELLEIYRDDILTAYSPTVGMGDVNNEWSKIVMSKLELLTTLINLSKNILNGENNNDGRNATGIPSI